MTKKPKGRRSKPNVPRYPCGKIKTGARAPRAETESQIKGTVLAYRTRLVGREDAMRNEAGYALGRMYLRGQITAREHRAGCDYAMLADQYRTCMGLPSPSPAAMEIGRVGGRPIECGPSAQMIRRVTNQYMSAQTALSEAGRAGASAVQDACVLDVEPIDVGALKAGLQALAGLFKVPLDMEPPR